MSPALAASVPCAVPATFSRSRGGGTRTAEDPPREITSPSTGMALVRIEPGEFMMGSPDSDKDAGSRREAAPPGADHPTVLPGEIRGDAGRIRGGDGRESSNFKGKPKNPVETFPGLTRYDSVIS